MKTKKNLFISILLLWCASPLFAQPTQQDCLGAILITQPVFIQDSDYWGQGNVLNEINNNLSCLGTGERNDVWYKFYTVAAGNVGFSIYPDNPNADYDWAVFKLNNAQCTDIYSNAALEVSCNYSTNAGCNGITGPNGKKFGIPYCNSQCEELIPCQAGDTFVINISKFIVVGDSGHSIQFINPHLLGFNSGFISGNVFEDKNGNCLPDSNEAPFGNRVLEIDSGFTYLHTDSLGNYFYSADTGIHTVTLLTKANQVPLCPIDSGNYVLHIANYGDTLSQTNFGDSVITIIEDAKITYVSVPPKPAKNFNGYIYYGNAGSYTISADTITLTYDSIITFLSSIPPPDYQAGKTLKWYYTNLLPAESRTIPITFSCPSNAIVGTTLLTTCSINPVDSDDYPLNNYDSTYYGVVASYDPNSKQVIPQGQGLAGEIPPNTSSFDYTVNFQNTGTAPAVIVQIIDTLDSNISTDSIKILKSSHVFTWQKTGNVLQITFNNINLPDSGSDEPASHGLISFRVFLQPNLPYGTVITNKAFIYFDINPPVETNLVTNTLGFPSAINEDDSHSSQSLIYPNPATNHLTIALGNISKKVKVTITDITGQVIYTTTATETQKLEVDTKDFAEGVYFVQVQTPDFIETKKLIVAK